MQDPPLRPHRCGWAQAAGFPVGLGASRPPGPKVLGLWGVCVGGGAAGALRDLFRFLFAALTHPSPPPAARRLLAPTSCFRVPFKKYISSKEINKTRRLKIITTTIKYGRSGFTHPLLGEPARGSPVLLLSLFLLPCPRPGGSARLGWARLGRARSSPGSRALPGPRSAGPDRVALPAPAPRRCGARRGGAGAAGPLSNPFPFSLAPQVKWSCMGNS